MQHSVLQYKDLYFFLKINFILVTVSNLTNHVTVI